MAEVTVETTLPLSSGKEAKLTLKDGEVEMRWPVSFKTPTAKLEDLRVALEELEAAQAANPPSESTDADPRVIALRETLKSLAENGMPITVAVDSEMPAVDYRIEYPVPTRLHDPEGELMEEFEARVIFAGSDDLAQFVRAEAESAGVRVIG